MEIKAVIVDEVPKVAVDCIEFKSCSVLGGSGGAVTAIVNCLIFRDYKHAIPFDYTVQRCPFCPLITKEEFTKIAP